MLLPAYCGANSEAASFDGRSREMKCVCSDGIAFVRTLNQCAESFVRSAPLSGTPFSRITSYADIRSVATKSRDESSSSYKSRTLPFASGLYSEERSVVVIVVDIWVEGTSIARGGLSGCRAE